MDWTTWISGAVFGGIAGTAFGIGLSAWAVAKACVMTGRENVLLSLAADIRARHG